jgi:hypothetical protein
MATASAQLSAPLGIQAGYQGLPVRPYAPNETGVPISDGVYLHGGVGTEMGYDSNVFYSDPATAGAPISSAILRVVPFLELNNQARGGQVPTGLFFSLAANLAYRHYFSGEQSIDDSDLRNSFNPTVAGVLDFSQGQTLGLSLMDTFSHTEEAPYFAGSGPIVRTSNLGTAQGRFSPGGGRIQGLLRYSNRLDLYQSTGGIATGGVTDYSYGNSMAHEGMLDASWRWFPKTAVFINAQAAFIQYLNQDPMIIKSDSTQLRFLGGLRGLVTERTTVSIALGYGTAFYENDINPSGIGLLSARADFTYRPTPLTALALGYVHDFQNSIIGNFYNVDGVSLSLRQLIAGRITASAVARYEHRSFTGPPANMDITLPTGSRTDNYLQLSAAVDYYLQTWAYLGVGYNLSLNASDATLAAAVNGETRAADYTKHQVFARLGVTY